MTANWQLYGELLSTFERILNFMGIWPGKQIPLIRFIIIATLSAFFIMFIIKTFTHPERESFENGLAVGLGCLMMVLLFIRLTINEKKLCEIIDFIKDDLKRTPKDVEKEILDDIGKDIQFVLKFVTIVFPMSVIIKVIMPFIEFGYGLITRDENVNIKLPPAMSVPSFNLGIHYELFVYIIECIIRMIMLFWLLGGAILYIVTSLYLGGQFRTLAKEFEAISLDDGKLFDTFIKRHELIISKAKTLNKIYSTHLFVDSAVSYINLAALLFSMFSTHHGLASFFNDMLLTMAGATQFGLIVIYGGYIMECSLLVYKGAYNCDWIGKPLAQQKKLIFVLQRGQRPISLSVYENFITASLEFLTNVSF
ncbi:hypothetical protein PVAND_013963 [Polypedilum vanderplanki]|uniref:Odorant receptor n=1 Tax=Polypedilum vanderplanki TaxID=319348 RepID=A0A9J6CRT8_POLVA|nr:hypothetical protein PVAND_013963 [Polypedilum vanderplanki]